MVTVFFWALACVAVDSPGTNGEPPFSDPELVGPVRVLPSGDLAQPNYGTLPGPGPIESTAGDQLFAQDVIQEIGITLSPEAFATLRDSEKAEVPGVLTWRGFEFSASFQTKGSSSYRPLGEKSSLKIDVHQYLPDQRIDGLKRLRLNNMIQDGVMVREHAYYWLATEIGVPAPRHSYTHLTLNGEDYGLYGIVEAADGPRLNHLFPEDADGNLYESSSADFTDARNWFDLKVTGGLVPSPDDMDTLVAAVDAAGTGVDFYRVFQERFDEDRVLDQLALDMVTGNSDGYVFNHHNFHVYFPAVSQQWVTMPWGTDRAFTKEVSPYGNKEKPVVGLLAVRCWADEACAARLRGRINGILEVWEEGGFTEMLATTQELVADACEADPKREKDCDTEDFDAYMAARVAYVRSEIEGEPVTE